MKYLYSVVDPRMSDSAIYVTAIMRLVRVALSVCHARSDYELNKSTS